MVEIILAIAGIALSLAGYAIPEIQTSQGNRIKNKLTKLGKEFYTRIQNNQKKIEDLYNAYVNKSSAIINSMMLGAGFGPRMESLKEALKENESRYSKEKDELTKRMASDNNAYNQIQNELVSVGTNFSANSQAKKVADEIEQNINGGLVKREDTSTNLKDRVQI